MLSAALPQRRHRNSDHARRRPIRAFAANDNARVWTHLARTAGQLQRRLARLALLILDAMAIAVFLAFFIILLGLPT